MHIKHPNYHNTISQLAKPFPNFILLMSIFIHQPTTTSKARKSSRIRYKHKEFRKSPMLEHIHKFSNSTLLKTHA